MYSSSQNKVYFPYLFYMYTVRTYYEMIQCFFEGFKCNTYENVKPPFIKLLNFIQNGVIVAHELLLA